MCSKKNFAQTSYAIFWLPASLKFLFNYVVVDYINEQHAFNLICLGYETVCGILPHKYLFSYDVEGIQSSSLKLRDKIRGIYISNLQVYFVQFVWAMELDRSILTIYYSLNLSFSFGSLALDF